MSNHRSSLSDASLFSHRENSQDNRLRLAYFLYTNLNTLLQPPNFDLDQQEIKDSSLGWSRRVTVVNSQIIGAVVNEPQHKTVLPEGQNVTVTLKHFKTGSNMENARCVYWNLDQQ